LQFNNEQFDKMKPIISMSNEHAVLLESSELF